MLDSLKFHHIGVAVRSIDETAALYENGGYKKSSIVFDPVQNVNICWLTKKSMPIVELLEPVDENSPVNRTLEKNGVAPYHTCYIAEDLESAVKELRTMKYVVVSKPVAAVAFRGCRVCFLFNRNAGLIELVETPATIMD